MATGRLGVANITTTADTSVYTCPTSTFAVVTVSVCNRGASAVNVRLALSASGTPALTEYLEFDTSLAAKGVLERTGIVMDASKQLIVTSSTASPTLSAVVYGIETTTV